MAQITQDINGNVTLQPDTTGNVNLVVSGTTVLSVTSNNVIAPNSAASVSFAGPLSVSNIVSNTTTFGYFINSTSGRNQLNNVGFTFNQDGDILTPTNKTRYAYAYTGSNQSFTVPSTVSWIYVKLWGAGGGAGRQGSFSFGADGGGGGHTRALVPVTPGATIYVVVGSGGYVSNGVSTLYGGGGTGAGTGDNQYAGMGGGYCGVFNGSISFANALAIAGGGGGGGSSYTSEFANVALGGAGGGAQAQRGMSALAGAFSNGGGGASTNAAGIGGVGNNNSGNAGAQLAGGNAGSQNYGGGGGAGYYGGGAGGYTNATYYLMAGGGGGSGYVIPTARFAATYNGQYRTPAMYWDNDLTLGSSGISSSYIELYGFGGQNTQNNQSAGSQSGGHAYAVIYY